LECELRIGRLVLQSAIRNPKSEITSARYLDSYAATVTINRVPLLFPHWRRAVAIKPPDLLNRIPSVAELLEKPPVRALVERWNRSVVAGGLRSFLDELGSDLQRRAAEVNLPSIRELAERAARYVVTRQHRALGVAINATGQLWGSPWTSLPISESALERAFATGREFGALPSPNDNLAQASEILCRLTGAQSAAVVHSYAGAMWLALAAVAADREVLVARAEVGDVGSSDSLPKLAEAANAMLTEVGTTNSALAADYEAATSPRTAAILTTSSDVYCIVGQTAAAELAELVALARARELNSIDALGTAPLLAPPATVSWPRRSAAASIAAGVDLVILRGDGLVGGPSCGILLGSKDVIRRITAHPLFAASSIDPLRMAALTATLECYESPTTGMQQLPVWQCLTVSIDNLRNRAERMAPQLAQAEGIASATPVETRSPLAAALRDGISSYGITLSPIDGDVAALDKQLRSARFPILGRIENKRIVLDLRTVLPRQDTTLIDALIGTKASEVLV
jgi:L-seryl-tRNA(Ser) seleniumtransferase